MRDAVRFMKRAAAERDGLTSRKTRSLRKAKAFSTSSNGGRASIYDRKTAAKADAVRSFQSTYLDHPLVHILGQVRDGDLALSRRSCDAGSDCLGGGLAASCLLLNATGGRDNRGGCGLGLDGGLAVGQATRASALAGRLAVLHDLIERLVELSRHDDGCRIDDLAMWVIVLWVLKFAG